MNQTASIYILQCADGNLYTGITRRSVEERVSEHMQGLSTFTARRRPVVLIFSEAYDRVDEAVAAERRIKGWSRAKKLAYVRGDFVRLSELARRAGRDPSHFETPALQAPQCEGIAGPSTK